LAYKSLIEILKQEVDKYKELAQAQKEIISIQQEQIEILNGKPVDIKLLN
jgi:hypothetical protein